MWDMLRARSAQLEYADSGDGAPRLFYATAVKERRAERMAVFSSKDCRAARALRPPVSEKKLPMRIYRALQFLEKHGSDLGPEIVATWLKDDTGGFAVFHMAEFLELVGGPKLSSFERDARHFGFVECSADDRADGKKIHTFRHPKFRRNAPDCIALIKSVRSGRLSRLTKRGLPMTHRSTHPASAPRIDADELSVCSEFVRKSTDVGMMHEWGLSDPLPCALLDGPGWERITANFVTESTADELVLSPCVKSPLLPEKQSNSSLTHGDSNVSSALDSATEIEGSLLSLLHTESPAESDFSVAIYDAELQDAAEFLAQDYNWKCGRESIPDGSPITADRDMTQCRTPELSAFDVVAAMAAAAVDGVA